MSLKMGRSKMFCWFPSAVFMLTMFSARELLRRILY
jgi:hypothetical protein